MLGAPVRYPLIRSGAVKSGFGGDHQACRIRMQGFRDNFFADGGAVGVGGVDKIDSQSDGASKNAHRFAAILRLAPNAFSSNAHGPKTEAVDREVSANAELSGLGCRQIFPVIHLVCVRHGFAFSSILLLGFTGGHRRYVLSEPADLMSRWTFVTLGS